jgi:hypothetical protein
VQARQSPRKAPLAKAEQPASKLALQFLLMSAFLIVVRVKGSATGGNWQTGIATTIESISISLEE